MISKNKIKYILALQRKKSRDEENLFLIEGDKLVKEFLNSNRKIRILAAKPEFLNSLPDDKLQLVKEIERVSYDELKQISSFKTPHNALAVVEKPELVLSKEDVLKQLSVVLDCVQDPGNLGTIIRAAAWFGIKTLICSKDCVDVYNPKVIQASMGAMLHVEVHYTDLKELLIFTSSRKLKVFGTLLEGDSIYSHDLGKKGIILLGNESKGISDDLIPYITDRILIPGESFSKPGIESLNVGMAASIVFSEFFRRGRI